MTYKIGGVLKTDAVYLKVVKLSNKTGLVERVDKLIKAVPRPLWLHLVEYEKLKIGGEASVRAAGASELSNVSVKNKK